MEHPQVTFERACLQYLVELRDQSPVVSTSHTTLAHLNSDYGRTRVAHYLHAFWDAQRVAKATFVLNWDDQNNVPHILIDTATLTQRGVLVAVDYKLVAQSAGIQAWSKV